MESTPAATESSEMRPWSAAEQATLEKALRTYPASAHKGPDRWDKVASMVEGRTKKEVVLRVKALVAKANKK